MFEAGSPWSDYSEGHRKPFACQFFEKLFDELEIVSIKKTTPSRFWPLFQELITSAHTAYTLLRVAY
jgi:hypothetical protein